MCDDARLVELARLGDAGAFDLLMARYYQRVRWFAWRFSRASDDVDDMVQATFVTAYERLWQLAEPEKFGGWLTAIARNECLMWKRKRYSQTDLFSLDRDNPTAQLVLDHISAEVARESARKEEIRGRVAQALLALTEAQRKTVELHYLRGYDYAETALLLQVSESTVRGRLDRARMALRRELLDMKPTDANTWRLDSAAMDALRSAAAFAGTNPDFPILNSILLTAKGQVVSTDDHRLICVEVPSLAGVPPAVVHADLGRMLRDSYPVAAHGRLTIGDSEAVVSLDGGEVRAKLLDEKYPDWESVVPAHFKVRAKASAGHWAEEIGALTSVCDSGLIDSTWPEHHRSLLVLSPDEERISVRAGDVIGNGGTLREFSVSFPAKFEPGSQEVIVALNAVYLGQAVRALRMGPEDWVEVLVNDEVSPVVFQSSDSAASVVVMPMQRKPLAEQSHSSREPESCGAS